MKKIPMAYLSVIIAMIIVGSTVVAGKMVTTTFPPFFAGMVRFGLASAALLPLFFRQLGQFRLIKGRVLGIILLQVFSGQFLFTVLLLNGLRFTGGTEAGIISGTTPALIALLSFLVLGEKFSRLKVGGVALTIGGLVVLNLGGAQTGEEGSQPLLGNLLVFGAVVGEALFIILGKVVLARLSGFATATLNCLLGFLFFVPFGIYEAFTYDFSRVEIGGWLYLVYYGLVGTVLAYLFWFGGSAHLPASALAGVSGVFPASAVVLSMLVLGERPGLFQLMGVGGVIGGLILLARLPGTGKTPERPFSREKAGVASEHL